MSGAEQSQWAMPARGSKQYNGGGRGGGHWKLIFSLHFSDKSCNFFEKPINFRRSSEVDLQIISICAQNDIILQNLLKRLDFLLKFEFYP